MDFRIVDIPKNEGLSVVVEGSPPKVVGTLTSQSTNVEGCFVVALKFPGLEISGLPDANTLEQMIRLHENTHRQLILSPYPVKNSQMLLYSHELPASADLGLEFDGFPARVKGVQEHSTFVGRIIPGQAVERIEVPGLDELTFESGGFTGHRVKTYLDQTAEYENRRLVLKDSVTKPKSKVSDYETRDPFDLGGFHWNPFRFQKSK